MTRTIMRVALGAAVVCASLGAVPAKSDTPCQLTMVGSLDFTASQSGAVVLPVTINGAQSKMIIDTGGAATMISEAAAKEFQVPLHQTSSGYFRNYHGDHLTKVGVIQTLQVGTLHADKVSAVVEPHWPVPDTIGALGPDFLMQFDVEFDFASQKMNLFSRKHCPGQVVYWTHDPAAVIPVNIDDAGHIVANVTIDGHQMEAVVDTGASSTVMKSSTAKETFGLASDTPGVKLLGSRPDGTKLYVYIFKSLDLDGIVFANPAIVFGGEQRGAETPKLILGRPELRKLHLFMSYAEHRLYATAAGAH